MKTNSKCSPATIILSGWLSLYFTKVHEQNTNFFCYTIKLDPPFVFLICIRWRHQR